MKHIQLVRVSRRAQWHTITGLATIACGRTVDLSRGEVVTAHAEHVARICRLCTKALGQSPRISEAPSVAAESEPDLKVTTDTAERGVLLYRESKAHEIDPRALIGVLKVQGGSREYLVTLTDDACSCGCKAWRVNPGQWCKHIVAAWLRIENNDQIGKKVG